MFALIAVSKQQQLSGQPSIVRRLLELQPIASTDIQIELYLDVWLLLYAANYYLLH